MRYHIAILLWGLLLPPVAHAWKLLSFPHFLLNNIYRIPTSPIPQFALDTRHPWIEENRSWLERRVDAASQLCALDSTLRPDLAVTTIGHNTTTTRSYPTDLFRRLEIDNNRYGVSRFGWGNAVTRLEEMLRCPAALLDATELYIHIFVHHDSYETVEEPSSAPAELAGLFIKVLNAMPNLRTLHWQISDETQELGPSFKEQNLTLPSVRNLHVGRLSEYMVGLCPGIQTLYAIDDMNWSWGYPSVDPHLSLVRTAASAKNLTEFGMRGASMGWDAKLLEDVLAVMPNLTKLDVRGSLVPEPYDYESGGYTGKVLKEFTRVLAKFPRLTDLTLPYSGSLGVGFDGGPLCGNAYDGPDGRNYQREVHKQGAKATERAAEIVLQSPLNLTSLTIGNTRLNLTAGTDIKSLIWPWSSGMDEWAWQVIPWTD